MSREFKLIGGYPHVLVQCTICHEWCWTSKFTIRERYACDSCVRVGPGYNFAKVRDGPQVATDIRYHGYGRRDS